MLLHGINIAQFTVAVKRNVQKNKKNHKNLCEIHKTAFWDEKRFPSLKTMKSVYGLLKVRRLTPEIIEYSLGNSAGSSMDSVFRDGRFIFFHGSDESHFNQC